ncbi:MAG TPA: M28 family peptidase [Candidatus Limnocylindrales bacterium]|nr:M28 family peptidase [Candidatus Limnocylindrales bacterium]
MNRNFLLLAVAATAVAATPASLDPKVYVNEVKYLASPELRGRLTGSPELERAAEWIATKYRECGIKPASPQGYLLPFQVTMSGKLGSDNTLAIQDGGAKRPVKFSSEFVPLQFSPAGHFAGAVVFAGYGITTPAYDDYSGINVKGKVVLILRHEPREKAELSKDAQFASKATNAKMHGAAAVILINDLEHHRGDADEMVKFAAVDGPENAGIPFIQVKEAVVDGWFRAAGRNVAAIEADVDRDLKPESFAFAASLKVNGTVDIRRDVKTVHNVAAYLPGKTNEYVIVGAHYDHLGTGERYSMAPDKAGTIHPGADDNASGTAGVIDLARWFAAQPEHKRGILFLNFAGEEEGLLGSADYADHPVLPLKDAAAMINMDMIGRVRNAKLYVGGSDTGTGLRAMLDRLTPATGLNIDYSDSSGYGSSDHTSFTTKQVPTLFFFSGLHSDYHKPSDTWDKIDGVDAVKVLELVARVTDELRDAPERPAFVRVAPNPHGEGAGPLSSAGGSGYGPYFGSIPDFGEGVKGVKFADVREGSPAAKAGFKGGDVLVEFDGKPIQNLYDFTYALQAKKAGDEVLVKVLRDGSMVEGRVLLTRRQ